MPRQRMGTMKLVQDSHDPTRTLLILDGKVRACIPWQQCDEIAKSFTRAARAGEQYEKANLIIPAEAALIRTGAPFALSNDPKIRDAAYAEAQWGDARKQMPMRGVPSPRQLGVPSVIKSKPVKEN